MLGASPTSRLPPYWRRYPSYLIVGGVVGIITVALRELVAFALAKDTPSTYAVSILVAYTCGIVLSFLGQARFTFRQRQQSKRHRRFVLFAFLAVSGALLTTGVARLIRYGLGFDELFGVVAPGLAFAIATLLVSIGSYAVNARFVFTPVARATAQPE